MTNIVCYHSHVEPKKQNKLVNITIKNSHTYGEQTTSEEKGEGQARSRELRGTNLLCIK